MSYLDLLRQRRAEQDSLGRLLTTVGSGLAESMVQEQTKAQQRAKILQQQGQAAARLGDFESAARVIPQLQESLRTGYGIKPSIAPPVGTPITRQQLGPVPLGAPPLPSVEVGRSFEAPSTRSAIRTGLMLEPTPPIRVGDALYFPDEQRFVEAPQEMRQPQQRMGWVRGAGGVETYRELVPGMVSLPPPRAPREPALTEVFDPNLNAMVVVPKRAGMVKPLPPVRVAMQDEQGNVVYVAQQPIAQPAGKGFRRPQAPRKASVAKPLTAQDMSRINDMAYDELARTTPGMIGDKRMIVMALQRDPALRARHASIVKGMADSIMSDRRAAAEAENASVGIKTPQQPAAPQRKSKILELLGG